jgi:colanic acid biosynthesis glycosyl transferase WcaI
MKFLILTQYFPPEIGAPQTRLHAMVRELQELGHKVEVVTALPNYPRGRIFPGYKWTLYRREDLGGAAVHRVWLFPAMGAGIARMLNYCSFAVMCLLGLIFAEKPDYLFVESPPLVLTLPACLYSFMRRVPVILNISDLWPDSIRAMGLMKDGPALEFLYRLERWSYRKATYINAMTEGIRSSLLEEKMVPCAKVLFLPNGVDTRRYRPQATDTKLKQVLGLAGKKIILYAGTQGNAHGLEFVLSAAKLLEADQQIHFLFVGDGSERARLESLQHTLQLRNVTFRNPVPLENLPHYFSIAEGGLASMRNLPIFEGARPSKMFPTFACGKPLIFVGKGEGARLVEKAQAGIVVPPENPEALAQAVKDLVYNVELASALGANGRKYVEDNYRWSRLVGDWIGDLSGSRSPGLSTGVPTPRLPKIGGKVHPERPTHASHSR